MLRLSLDALLTVDTIARRGSFSAAAKELYRVPSTISYTVSKLEEDLGVQLFERFGPRVVLTAAGEELLKEGRYLLKAAADLESRVRRVASGWETEFAIGMDSALAPLGLQDDIRAFYEVADQTRLRIVREALSGTWESLLDRRVDLLVGAAGEGPSGGGYTAEPLGTMAFVFVVAPAHPLAQVPHRLGKADLSAHRRWPIRCARCRRARWGCCSARMRSRCPTCRPSTTSSWPAWASASCPKRGRALISKPAGWWKRRWMNRSRTKPCTWPGAPARKARR
jgi:DNA-binding transcriptional LysR family regulator